MTHEELRAKIDEHIDYGTCGVCDGKCYKEENIPWLALRAVVEYAKELSETDYRGNPPAEHYIAKKLYAIIEKELK